MSAPTTMHALILERESPLPPLDVEVADILARRFDRLATDVRTELRGWGGIVVHAAPHDALEELRQELEGIGMRTRIVPSADLRDLPRGRRARGVRFEDDRVVFLQTSGREVPVWHFDIVGIDVWGEPGKRERPGESAARGQRKGGGRSGQLIHTAAYAHPGLVVGHYVHEKMLGDDVSDKHPDDPELVAARSMTADDIHQGPPRRYRRLVDALGEVDLADLEFHLALFCRDPYGAVRLEKDAMEYSSLGVDKTDYSLENFLRIVDRFLEIAPDAWNREPWDAFRADLEGSGVLDPRSIVRDRIDATANLERWILSWIRLEDDELDRDLADAEIDS